MASAMLQRGRMGVYRFEDLRVWQAAKAQCDRVGELITAGRFAADYPLRDQINGASLSTMNNISEGFVRRRDAEMRQFLRYAAASNAEVRSCLYAAEGRKYLTENETAEMLERNDSIGKMLRRFMASLQEKRRTKRSPGPRTRD